MKKIPMRRCVASGQSFPKKELLRIVRNKEGIVKVDPTGKANGKGAYLQKSLVALAQARKSKALAKALATAIPEEVYAEIERLITAENR